MEYIIVLIIIAAIGGFIYWKKGPCSLGTVTDANLVDTGGGDQKVGFKISSDGHIYVMEERHEVATRYVKKEKWIGSCPASRYECRITLDSGPPVTGDSLDVWLSCDQDRMWELLRTTVGKSESNCTFELRAKGAKATKVAAVTMSVLRAI